MDNGTSQIKFLAAYSEYVNSILEPTRLKLKDHLSAWQDIRYWEKYSPSEKHPTPYPIQRVRSRIKRPESVVDKILRKPETYPNGLISSSFVAMQDTLGSRVIVYFLSQLPLLDREIRSCGYFELSQEYPPVAYLSENLYRQLGLQHIERQEKDSGYASIHYVLRLAKPADGVTDNPYFELQLRTLAEDLWGEVEHILGYKPNKRTSFAVRKQFKIISRSLEALDEHFNFLFEELNRFQEEGTFQNEDPLNAENLPYILREVGLGCGQSEIDGLLKLLFSRGVRSVAQMRKVATSNKIQLIRNIYLKADGRHPANFEYVANLANLEGIDDENEITVRVQAQRDFLEFWSQFRKERR